MLINSFQVEVQSLTTGEWSVDECFCPIYKWRQRLRRVLWFPLWKWSKPVIDGDPHIAALIAKTDAHLHARHVVRQRKPRNVRIARVEREGARLVKYTIWQNGHWLEE